MKILNKTIETDYNGFYLSHVRMVNAIFGSALTSKEVKVLSVFMAISSYLDNGYVLDSITRKQIMKELNMFPGGLSNHTKSIKEKGFIENVKGKKGLKIKDFMIPEKGKQLYQICLKEMKEDDTE